MIEIVFVIQAREMQGVHDHEGNSDLMLALSRYSWKVRVNRLLEVSQKPTIQQVQQQLKEVCPADIK